MAESQAWNTLGYVEKCLVASKASMNAAALGSKGNNVKLSDCGIDTMKISTLGEYLAARKRNENPVDGKGWDKSLEDDEKLAKTFVVPVILPNGQEIEVIVNSKGQDMACIYKDEAGNEKEFQLTPRMKKAIKEMTPSNLKDVIGEEVYKEQFLPDNLDEFAEKVSKDELVPKNKKQAAKIAGIDVEETEKEEQKEREDAEKEVPAEARDVIAKICSEHDLDIANLKEVMEVEPEVIEDNLEQTGIKENNGRVYCLRFRDASNLQGRVVMVQGDKAVDDRRYDKYMNDYMNEHKGEKRVKEIEDDHDKLSYTDLDGNTTVCEITREPRDLNCSEKELLQEKMQKLVEMEAQILSQEAKTPEEKLYKVQQCQKINNKRLETFKDFGVDVPLVKDEINADRAILDNIENNIEDKMKEEKNEESTGIEGYEEHYGHAETGYEVEKQRK